MAEILLHSDITQPRNPWKPASRIHDSVVSLSTGLEAPWTSLDFPLDEHDDTTTVRQKTFKGSIPDNQATSKKLIRKQMPSQPSVIARLMGMDTTPIPGKDAVTIQAEETSNLKSPSAAEIKVTSRQSTPFKQSKCSQLSYHISNGDYRRCLKKMRLRKGRSRRHHHPHEELLQKSEEDFQAWQPSKVLDSARTVAELGRSKPLDGRYIQILAQENLRKEKMAKYGYGGKNTMENKVTLKNAAQEGNSEIAAKVAAESRSEERVIKVLRVTHCAGSEKCRALEAGKGEHDHTMSERLGPPTRIVILKPSSDVGVDDQEPLFGSLKVKRDSNKEFLEEVKERLKKELKVKARSEVIRTTWGTDPKQIARDIAKQIRETVTKDLGIRLSRSESFRAFRSDRKRNAAARHASPEHVMVNTRNISAHRLDSVDISRTETLSEEKIGEESKGSSPIRSRGRVRSLTDICLSGIGFGEQSCTGEYLTKQKVDNVVPIDTNVVSPRALVRSFSAPASGVSQGRLFLEDNVGCRKHGTSDIASEGAAVTSKSSSFSFRGTVSSLRHSFTLGGKLFGRKTRWSKKPSLGEFHFHPQMDIGATESSPQASCRFTVAQANFTELPPSPVSPLEVEGHSSRHFFSDLINCTFPELSPKCSSELEAPISELSYRTNDTADTESNRDKAYIREVLITAGLCDDDGSLDSKANGRVDWMARPICDYVFEEVEEVYYYRDKNYRVKKAANGDDEIGMYSNTEENAMDHRMLFDVANEALQILLGSVKTGSSFYQWVAESTGMSRGRKLQLVDDVWQQVQAMRNPPMQQMQTIDSMVASEVRKSAWAEVLYDDVYVVGRKIERAIFDELIGDIVHEVFI